MNITEPAPPYVIEENLASASANGAVHWIGCDHGK